MLVDRLKQTFSERGDIIIDWIDVKSLNYNGLDLYQRLRKNFKESFASNEKIIIELTGDFYPNGQDFGQVLKNIQVIVNFIDISNFFITIVTTNTKIYDEYTSILESTSIDKVPFNLILIDGVFKRLDTYVAPISYDDLNYSVELSESEKDFLFNKKHFCMAPWVHLMVETNGVVRLCCQSRRESIGDVSKSTLREIWNDEPLKNIRLKMLNNEYVPDCKQCYDYERDSGESLRTDLNKRHQHDIQLINKTDSSGFLHDFSYKYWDIRFNNLCNLTCRTCNPRWSSSWIKPTRELYDSTFVYNVASPVKDLVDQLLEHIDVVETVYFVGGEPLIMEEHYRVLDNLIANKKTDIRIIYNSNLTNFTFKKTSIIEYWNQFSNVAMQASIDGIGKRGEYIRQGSIWNQVLANRKQMIAESPHVDFSINTVASIFNTLHIPDFQRYFIEEELIDPSKLSIHLLSYPEYQCVQKSPSMFKEAALEKLVEHCGYISNLQITASNATLRGLRGLINRIQVDDEYNKDQFWKGVAKLDNYFNTSLLDVFPELKILE